MPPKALLLLLTLLLLLPAELFVPDFAHSSPRRRSQHLEDVRRHAAAQVLPGPLSCYVPQLHISTEVLNQQAYYILAAVNCGDVEGRVAACRPCVYVEVHTNLLNPVPETVAQESNKSSHKQSEQFLMPLNYYYLVETF